MDQSNLNKRQMSQPEIDVASFFSFLGINWKYEFPVHVTVQGLQRVWYPDFYLPEFGLYVEVCGIEREEYVFREIVYKENCVSVIFLHAYKYDKWPIFLINQIKQIEHKRWSIIQNCVHPYLLSVGKNTNSEKIPESVTIL